MEKIEKGMKLHNCIDVALVVFWLTDLVLTTVNTIKGYSTMTSVDIKLANLSMMVDFLWIFGIAVKVAFYEAVSKINKNLLHIIDYLMKDAENGCKVLEAVTEKPESVDSPAIDDYIMQMY